MRAHGEKGGLTAFSNDEARRRSCKKGRESPIKDPGGCLLDVQGKGPAQSCAVGKNRGE